MAGVFAVLVLISVACLVWGLVSPEHLSKAAKLRSPVARKHIGLSFGFLTLLFLVLVGVTTPKQPTTTLNAASASKQTTVQSSPQSTPTTTTTTTTETSSIPFTTKTEDDNNLTKGQSKVIQAGQNGVQTTTYLVTSTNGTQTSKVQQSQTVTTQPVQEITEVGAYVVPAPTPPPAPKPTPAPTPAPSSSCHPLTNGGNCYEPGEYCRDTDHGVVGVAGDGETITCENNNGWRWEP